MADKVGSPRVEVFALVTPCDFLGNKPAPDLIALFEKDPSGPYNFPSGSFWALTRVTLSQMCIWDTSCISSSHPILDLTGTQDSPGGAVQSIPR